MVRKLYILLVLLVLPVMAYSKTYEIIEQDFVETAIQFSKTPEFKKMVQEQRKKELKQIRELKGETLVSASEYYEYSVPYIYTLTHEIPKVDKNGNYVGALYPKGFQYEPLKYMKNPLPLLVVFNPCNKEELSKVKVIKAELDKNYTRYYLLSSGCSIEQMKNIKPIGQYYLLDKDSVKLFNLKYTISIVSADLRKGVFNVKVIPAKTRNENSIN